MIKVLLKSLLIVLGIMIISLSFFFGEKDEFSSSRPSMEDIYKKTHFTKLTKLIYGTYIFLIIIFMAGVYFFHFSV